VAYHNKGYIYNGLLSDPSQAVSEFTEAILLNANYPQAHVNRAFALIDLGRIEDAKRDFKKALDLSPNFEPAIKGLNDLQ
jgi:Flp pilus assembly protein TadD